MMMMMMSRTKLSLITLAGCWLIFVGLVDALKKKEIFLPPDTDVLTVVGKGFKLELSHFEEMSKTWKDAEKDSSQVEAPKTMGGNANNESQGDEKERERERKFFEELDPKELERQRQLKRQQELEAAQNKDYGLVDEELQRWIDIRATALIERLDRYSDEMASVSSEGERVVVEVLQLNTLSQLEDLVQERIPSLGWIQKKLNALAKLKRYNKQTAYSNLSNYIWSAINDNLQVEARVKGTNNPGKQWLRNSSAIKRVSNEQRFAQTLDTYVNNFFSREFSMMKRSLVLDILKGTEQVNDGLVYWNAKGRVSADFPFSAQDAIANGAIY